ncbi:MAG: TonB-dependent receptor [Sideroxydans sp.]|nr:TonB-dependent receptor [Sideroxydans sp.]
MQNKQHKNLGLTPPRDFLENTRGIINQTITQTIVQSVNFSSPQCVTQTITQSFQGVDSHLVSQTIAQSVCPTTEPKVSQTITQSFADDLTADDTQALTAQTIAQEIVAADVDAGAPTEISQTVTQTISTMLTQSIKQSVLLVALLAAQTSCLGLVQAQDLADFSLAQLLDTKVSSAAKYEQATRDAPAAVQVISAAEIASHGWTSLAQALNSLVGMYGDNDRVYDYQGARGLLIAGDYNTRFLLLIDGQRNNDNVYGQALLGSEGWLDMSVIERVEYIPGPDSALYGSNAMLGTINVITKRATRTPQRQIGAQVSSGGLAGVTVLGAHQHGETGLLLQYSQVQQAGRDVSYQNPQNLLVRKDGTVAANGVAHGLDFSNNRHALVRLDHDEWSLKLIAHERAITPSSAPWMTVFDDPSLQVRDGGQQLSLSQQRELSPNSNFYAAMSYTAFHYRTRLPYFSQPVGYYQAYDDTQGQVLHGETTLQLQAGNHHLLTGIELSQDLLARQHLSFSVNPSLLGTREVNINPLSRRSAAFIQDEWQLQPAVALNLGVRGDAASHEQPSVSPRLGLVWQIAPAWTSKVLIGRAYRSPSAYEKLFGDGVNVLANPALKAETLDTKEVVFAWRTSRAQHWQMSLFDNHLQHAIQQVDVNGLGQLQFQNIAAAHRQGLELVWQMQASDEAHWSASLAQNRTPNATGGTDNMPRHVAKAGYTQTLFNAATLNSELQFISPRHYQWRATTQQLPSSTLLNATLTLPNLGWRGLQGQLRIDNLLNRAAAQPASAEMLTPNIPHTLRTFSLKLDYAF